jgi:hypothetical protein
VKRLRHVLRWVGRAVVLVMAGAFLTVAGLQYARIIEKNLSMANRLAAAQSDVRELAVKRDENDARIRRLLDPEGAIPEIHDKLHLVRDGEAIIYLKKHDGGQ